MSRGGSFGGGSFGGGSRGSSRSSFGSSRGSSRSSVSSRSRHSSYHHTTVFIGGGGHHYSRKAGFGTFIVTSVVFIAIGLLVFALGCGFVSDAAKYGKTLGRCLKNEKVHGWYYTTYEYTVDELTYKNRSIEGWEFPEENEYAEIYYLKEDPNVITEEEPASIGAGIGLGCVGLVFVGVGIVLIRTSIKKKKNGEFDAETEDSLPNSEFGEEGELESATVSTPKPEEKNITCAYCGSKYDKNLSACPRCGAGKN